MQVGILTNNNRDRRKDNPNYTSNGKEKNSRKKQKIANRQKRKKKSSRLSDIIKKTDTTIKIEATLNEYTWLLEAPSLSPLITPETTTELPSNGKSNRCEEKNKRKREIDRLDASDQKTKPRKLWVNISR